MKLKKVIKSKKASKQSDIISVYKKRMLLWDSPVEYVNNMYGCHPNEFKLEYFDKVYKNERK